ncbi:MAG TPA: acetylornithine deacetylase [Paracoccaceae bacterium]|nr:acetylornithine deacetylase [Paracoccaceae bacterium]
MGESLSPREMLARLVAFPTVSRDSNLDLVAFVRAYLEGHGVAAHLVPSPDGLKANLFAQIGPEVAGGVVLSGHTDVVPVDGQDWSSDPFRLVEREGKLFGRGTCDMKGFVAIVLALVPEMAAAGLKRPIQIALSYDEEVGHLGVPGLIAALGEHLPKPSAVLVGEPTLMRVVTSHKGGVGLTTHVRGFEVHSSRLHTGVSAITAAARLILWHADQTEANRREAERLGPEAPGALFDPPYTTLHNGLVSGGTAVNITARDCRFSSDIRTLPSESGQAWLDRYRAFAEGVARDMQSVRPETGIDIELRMLNDGCRREPGGAAEALARRLTGDNAERAVPFGTEASNFQRAGHSVCVIGPGSIDQAHQPDEFLSLAELEAGTAFVRRLIAHLAA